MEATYFVGIDISAGWLDWAVADGKSGSVEPGGKTANTPAGIERLLALWADRGLVLEELVVCFEHTGVYGLLLAVMLQHQQVRYVMVAAAEVRYSLGIQRGKSDPLDAERLAFYSWLRRQQLSLSAGPSPTLLQVRSWLVWREQLVKQRAALTNHLKMQQTTAQVVVLEELLEQIQQQREQLTGQIRQADRQIRACIQECRRLDGLYRLLLSVPGVGPVIAGWLLVYTHGFTRFAHARQLACFVGSAPFPDRSGLTVHPDRVSRWRCRRLKTLLYNGAHTAVQHDAELGHYFRRKCSEGKHPQSVMNAVVSKLLGRVFAVVQRGTPYVKTYGHQFA